MEKKFLTVAALIVGFMVLIALWIGLRHDDHPPTAPNTDAASSAPGSPPPSSPSAPSAPGSGPGALPLPDDEDADGEDGLDHPDAGAPAGASPDAGDAPDADAAPPSSSSPAASGASSAPSASVPPSAGSGNAEAPRGSLSKETIRGAIGAMKPTVQRCYEQLLEDYPDAGGRIVLSFEVVGDDDGTGHIDLESVKPESELHEEELHQCMLDALRQVDFPAPEGGSVRVTYPFIFSNAADPPAP